ncbi:MAG: hypothetical protein PHX44_06070 [Sulfurimonas sp.]|nr:hypothetical protein [Sulfurimonas sp.]MDD2652597.1 hypothetical protein [Sulfurimonas sp.]
MDKTKELSASSLQSSKIVSQNGDVRGIFSAIYLNEVYPETFNEHEYFFIFIYLKEAKELHSVEDGIESSLKLTLNSKLPVKIKKLPKENQFSHLIDTTNNWNTYYLVAFETADKINLSLSDEKSLSAAILKYKKE